MKLDELKQEILDAIVKRRVENAMKWREDKKTFEEVKAEMEKYEELNLCPNEDHGFEDENWKLVDSPMFHVEGECSETHTQQMIFLQKSTGDHYAFEAWHNSYEYMEFDEFYKCERREEIVIRWREVE